jgi:anti-anti-sigma regulatory factor
MVLIEPPTAFVKIAGRAAAESANDFKRLIVRLHGDGISRYCLDLTGCLLMDSTFSGVLAGLATELGPDGACDRFTLVGANVRVLDLLENLGVLDLVNVLDGGEILTGKEVGAEVARGEPSKDDTTRCCLEAHRLLMRLKPENAAKFRPVVEMIENQLAA